MHAILWTLLLYPLAGTAPAEDYLLLATRRASTMEAEMSEAAEAGYRFHSVMAGETAFGGPEMVVIMSRGADSVPGRFEYLLAATSRTSTMQEELERAARDGFRYRGQTFSLAPFRGPEVVTILERDRQEGSEPQELLLLATRRTSTMQRELREAARDGFELAGLAVGGTAFAGEEILCILYLPQPRNPGPP